MKNNFDNKTAGIKEQENKRRIELGMLGLLIEEYPNEAREKLRKVSTVHRGKAAEKPLVLRE